MNNNRGIFKRIEGRKKIVVITHNIFLQKATYKLRNSFNNGGEAFTFLFISATENIKNIICIW